MRAFSLPVASADVVTFGDRKTLVVERFDRRWTGKHRLERLHQEDMCQALSFPSSRKYESDGGPGIVEIMSFLQGSDHAQFDRRTFFSAQVIFWLIGATDGHAKNFSLRLRGANRFSLAPLYDVMTLQPLIDSKMLQHKHFKLSMSMGERPHYRIQQLTRKHVMATARRSGLSVPEAESLIVKIIDDAESVFDAVAGIVDDDVTQAINESVMKAVSNRCRILRTSVV